MIIDDPIIAEIKKRLLEKSNRISMALSDNSVSSLEDYRHKTGIIRGYKESISIIDNLIRELIDNK